MNTVLKLYLPIIPLSICIAELKFKLCSINQMPHLLVIIHSVIR